MNASTQKPYLQVKDITVAYGAVPVLHSVSIDLLQGEIISILGANGAGKTTTLLSISGLLKPLQGEIIFDGKGLYESLPHEIVGLGITHSPEGRRVFGTMSVLENLRLGAFIYKDEKTNKKNLDWIFSLFPRLHERSKQLAGTLSGGEQQMLAIGRALMGRPKVLLLDEPSLGLAPILVQAIFETIRTINKAGVSIVLVEQNVKAALELSDRAYVLESGKIVLHDNASKLLKNPEVQKAYLGAE